MSDLSITAWDLNYSFNASVVQWLNIVRGLYYHLLKVQPDGFKVKDSVCTTMI